MLNEKFSNGSLAGAWLIQARRFAARSSTRQTNSLNSDKKVNSKPSETGRSPLNRLANRPVILRTPTAKNADKTLFFAKEKPKPNTFVFDLGFVWRRGRDSNPCGVAPKRFSRPPRCDRFDTSPYCEKMRSRFRSACQMVLLCRIRSSTRNASPKSLRNHACRVRLARLRAAFDLPFQYSKRGAVCQDSRGHKNRKPRHAAAFGRKSIR